MSSKQEYQLDLRNYTCPLPLLMTKKAIKSLEQGSCLVLLLNKQTSLADLYLLCQEYGYKGEVSERNELGSVFKIETGNR